MSAGRGLCIALLGLSTVILIHCNSLRKNNDVLTKEEARELLISLKNHHAREINRHSQRNKDYWSERFHKRSKGKRGRKRLRKIHDLDRRNYNSNEGHGGAQLDSQTQVQPPPYSDLASLMGSMIVQHMDKFGHAAEPHKPFGMDNVHRQRSADQSLDSHKLTHKQKVEMGLESENGGDGGPGKRNFLSDPTILWPQGIVPYEIHSSLSGNSDYVNIIEKSVEMFANLTCVRWVKRTDPLAQNLGHDSYISFFSESGCWSYVGRVFPQEQQISLQAPYCVKVPIVIHEMCHAIGQMHEQSRSDRDNYVSILWQNLSGGQSNNNMAKYSTLDNNPYDHESVLQYGLYAFSTNGQPTMEFKDRRLDFLADSATGLMFYDIQDVIDAYKCADNCAVKPVCQNGGFVNHRCECFCPSGLTGPLCESTTSMQPECGSDQILVLPGSRLTIQSPNYPNNYPVNTKCVWLVKAPAGMLVRMTIDDMHLSDNGNTCYHWLEVQYNLIGQTGPRRCGVLNGISYTTSIDGDSNMMLLKFDSAFAADRAASRGFKLTVEAVGTGCVVNPCRAGTCVEGDAGSYTCNCQPGWHGIHCDTPDASLTLTCTFEPGSYCFMDNVVGDIFNWTSHTQGTPSSGTGPSVAREGTWYLYTEMSSPRVQGDIARFETFVPILGSVDRCLTFWYFMYGSTMGTLSLYSYTTSVDNRQNLWSKSGNLGEQWFEASVSIPIIPNVKIGFEAVRGTSWSGDIAIDNITLATTACSIPPSSTSGPTTPSLTTPSTPPTTPVPDPCNSQPCRNGGTCVSQPGLSYYQCICLPEWTGRSCETSLTTTMPDPCISNPCYNGGTCMSQGSAFWCQCAAMWTGTYCENYISTPNPDPCFSNPCYNGGTCMSQGSAFWCQCDAIWTGTYCESYMSTPNPDPCFTNPCMNNGTCYPDHNSTNGHYCLCMPGWTGAYCEYPDTTGVCSTSTCMNNGTCYPDPNSAIGHYCLCMPGWTGAYCEYPDTTGVCSTSTCMNNGTCYPDPNSTNGHYCLCMPGWTGAYCEYPDTTGVCSTSTCMNNGTCYPDPNSAIGHYCLCMPGWTGAYCEYPDTTGVCSTSTCMNNGTCYPDPNSTNGHYCLCMPGWTGAYCEYPDTTGVCSTSTCMNNGTCYPDPNSTNGHYCLCMPGWTGAYCEYPDTTGVCSTSTCMNNGTCYPDPNSAIGHYCLCMPGWTGAYCEYPDTTGVCSTSTCMNNGTCYPDLNSAIGHYCLCMPGWTGAYCEYPDTTGVCSTYTCMNNGTCYPDPNSTIGHYCLCMPGWTGAYCEYPDTTGVCSTSTCMNNGTCYPDLNSAIGHYCLCMPGWTGAYCEYPDTTGVCSTSTCMNNGTCYPDPNSIIGHYCLCMPGWTGAYCEYPDMTGVCSTYTCMNNGTCYPDPNSTNGHYCLCMPGWTGAYCEYPDMTDPCFSTPCLQNGTCIVDPSSASGFFCICDQGWSGMHCEYPVSPTNPCQQDPCLNNATCYLDPNTTVGYWCGCSPEWTGIHCESPAALQTLSCTVEEGDPCFLHDSKDGDFQWTRKKGPTPSVNTGPSSAFQGEYYYYMEASFPQRLGDQAWLESTDLFPDVDMCLSFYYHAYGRSIGLLNVIQDDGSVHHNLWGISDDMGDVWHHVQLDIRPYPSSHLIFQGVVGPSFSGDIAIDDIKVQKGHCPPTPVSDLKCSFEPYQSCFLRNIDQDDFDWTENEGPTLSSGTGPESAFEGRYYSYIEATAKREFDIAVLQSSDLDIQDYMCLHFAFSMYGDDMGTLVVQQGSSADNYTIFYTERDHGKGWHETATELIPMQEPSKISFIGLIGSSYRSDIAIDDIVINKGKCLCASDPCRNGGTCLVSPATATSPEDYYCSCPQDFTARDCSVFDGMNAACSFETDTCLFRQSDIDDFDWTRQSGNTPSGRTGPSKAADGQYYVYIETSSMPQGFLAMLESRFDFIGDYCLSFSYHMYGGGIGFLNVSMYHHDNAPVLVWSEQGSKGDVWHSTAVALSSPVSYQLLFIASIGTYYLGDIAIDDVKVERGSCGCASNPCQNDGTCIEDRSGNTLRYKCHCRSGYTGPMCESSIPGIHLCDFSDPSSCFIKNVGSDDFDWSFDTQTPSYGTGPQNPHDGNFAYIETSSPRRRGDTAVLSTEGVSFAAGDYCLEFYYHMYGVHMGALAVVEETLSGASILWSEGGNQGDAWHFARVDVSFTSSTDHLEIVGERGSSYTGDAAIDDVKLYPGRCV